VVRRGHAGHAGTGDDDLGDTRGRQALPSLGLFQ
jgi:hypothetical protein